MILMPDTELKNGGDKDKPESPIQTHQWRPIWFAFQVIIFYKNHVHLHGFNSLQNFFAFFSLRSLRSFVPKGKYSETTLSLTKDADGCFVLRSFLTEILLLKLYLLFSAMMPQAIWLDTK